MTLRIEISSNAQSKVLHLTGELRTLELEELSTQLKAAGPALSLDLAGLGIVDIDAVQFLVVCENRGVPILNCPPYVRKWMNLEKGRTKRNKNKKGKQ